MHQPELGQMIFGNAYAQYDLGNEEGLVANELYALSEKLGRRDPDAQSHGMLGGEWGYGQNFANEVFEMHPYYWGDCECGFEETSAEWDAAHPHNSECWKARWHEENERLHALNLGWDEQQKQLRDWEQKNGWDGRPGVAVYCDCGTQEEWEEWISDKGHESSCRVILPNFCCGDIEVRWYKYIGRGMSVNRLVSRSEWREIFSRCFASLEST